MDFEGAQIDFTCPDCGFINSATLGDAMNGSSIICVGCLRTIEFTDGEGSTKRAIDEVNQVLNDLGKVLRRGH